MSAYMVVIAELTDPAGFMAYAKAAGELVAKMGGEYVVRGAKDTACLEGDWPDHDKVVISKWPSVDAAKAFWNSDEYTEVKKLREGKANCRVRIVEGIA